MTTPTAERDPMDQQNRPTITTITVDSSSIELDNGENLRDLTPGWSVELRPDTGYPGNWICVGFLGRFRDETVLQAAANVTDCGFDCAYAGTGHSHPVDTAGVLHPAPLHH